MKSLRYFLLSLALLAVVVGCEDEPDGYSVDSGSFCIEAFGPNPVVRGETLQFVGQKLNQVTSVILPENVQISSSEFIDFTSGSFSVTVPSECEVGYVTVNYGNNKSVTLSTQLTFTETFEIYSVAPQDESKTILEAGDSVVVSGEYLNNVVTVGFENGVTTDEIGTQTRNELVFAIPKGATSGLIYCEDSNGYQVYSSESLTIDQPLLTGMSPLNVRPGDEVTITGEMLDQIVSVTFTGSSAIEAEDFVSAAYDAIVVTVPYDAQDGTLSLVTEAEQTLTTSESVTITVPSNLSVAPETVYKAGLNVVISGDDLDLVSAVSFSSGASADFVYSNGTITAAIPTTAVDGVITLTTYSTKTVDTDAITLVKPAITGLSVTEITAGDSFTITGTDLDLVTGVTLAGASCEFTINDATSITVASTATSVTGAVAVTAANGDSATCDTQLTVVYDSYITVTSLTASAKIGESVTMEGSNFNMIEAIYFGETKVTSYSVRSDNTMTFVVPDIEGGTYNPTFLLTTGETEICAMSIAVTGATETRVIFEGSHDLGTGWSNALQSLCWNGPFYDNNIPYGTTLTVEFTCDSSQSYWQLGICDPNGWATLESGSYVNMPSADTTEWTYELTNNDVDVLNARGVILAGYAVTITKVYVTYAAE